MRWLAVLLTLLLGVGLGSAGYVDQTLANQGFSLYYKVNMDQYHVGISLEDNGRQEDEVDAFMEASVKAYYDYVTRVNPRYTGYLNIVGFEYVGGPVETFNTIGYADEARSMSLASFIDMMFYRSQDTDVIVGDEPVSRTYTKSIYIDGGSYGGDWLSPGGYRSTTWIEYGAMDPQPEPPIGTILIDSAADGFNPGEAI